nr:hypothetical protein [uncultured Shinella sp.]
MTIFLPEPFRYPLKSGTLPMALFAGLLFSGSLAHACKTDAQPIFSCEADGRSKFIELCASGEPGGVPSALQYRFGSQTPEGRDDVVELEFPDKAAGSLGRFFGAVYTHKGVYTQSVRFKSGGFSYTVFTESWPDADSAEGAAGSAGVTVRNLRTGKSRTVDCSERPRFYIFELQNVLACDPATPVGKACIQ